MATRVTPLCQFRVFPSRRSRLYTTVKVFASLKAMYAYVKQTNWYNKGPIPNDYDALCRSWVYVKKGRMQPEMGDILLVQGLLQSKFVSHECMHATFEFMRRKKVQMPDRLRGTDDRYAEEIVCLAVGDMSSQVYMGLTKHGV
jgi:hypothetical protein